MPMYSLLCTTEGCNQEAELFAGMNDDHTMECMKCSGKMTRNWEGHPIRHIKDEIVGGMKLDTLRSIHDPANPVEVETVYSRTELANYIEKHDRMYGAQTEHAG